MSRQRIPNLAEMLLEYVSPTTDDLEAPVNEFLLDLRNIAAKKNYEESNQYCVDLLAACKFPENVSKDILRIQNMYRLQYKKLLTERGVATASSRQISGHRSSFWNKVCQIFCSENNIPLRGGQRPTRSPTSSN